MTQFNASIGKAIHAARAALKPWSQTSQEHRNEKITAIAAGYKNRKREFAETICRETGKPRWEAALEVDAMIAKAAISIAAQAERAAPSSRSIGHITAATRFVPIGVIAVLGPFNMPGHLPNGHILPALLAGNTVVFKPSELTPEVGQIMAETISDASLPSGVLNLVQGGPEVGAELVLDPDVNGVCFTGSRKVGGAIHKSLAGQPEKMLALEMGGDNPLIVWDCSNLDAAAYTIIQSAFISSGQRCSCARRLIVRDGPAGDALVERLMRLIPEIKIGLYTDEPEPFMGPVISPKAADAVMRAQEIMLGQRAVPLIHLRRDERSASLLHPGLIDVTAIPPFDEEIFGPLLQLIRVPDFETALARANQTTYGLSAGLLSDRLDLYDQFRKEIRAGVVNFNSPLTGGRSDLPFGGLGSSGNHRPSAAYAVDYCRDPVASIESTSVVIPDALPPGIPATIGPT